MKIGIIIPLGEDQETKTCPPFSETKRIAQAAEAAGLDSIWVYDHLLYRFPDREPFGVQECFTTWAALAAVTNRVEIGSVVVCTAFRNPAVVAKMAVTLDEISGGRIILGLGAGWHKPEFDAFDLRFDHRVDQFEEALKIIVPLVKQGEVDFQGTYTSAPNCAMLPKPAREIPVLIASKGPRMLDLTAEYADQWNTAWFGGTKSFLARQAEMNEALDKAERDRSSLTVTAGIVINFPDLEALDEAANDPDKVISGTVEEVAEVLAAYERAGCEHVIAQLSPLTDESINRYARAKALAATMAG
ncbi:MAG: LLM class flavin-dependent oxidoreductase [Thermomicrobiales bacterium]|nr:LLM class flavin-dependent oxidoreductase [Thermomicrobiales bacterium]